MCVPQARLLSNWFDQVASAGTTRFLLLDNGRRPTSLSLCGVEHFVLDGTAVEVSFEPSSTRFTSFLVGEPKTFPLVVRRCLPSLMGILVAPAGVMSESILVQERKHKKATEEKVGRRAKDGGHGRERRKKATKKNKCVGKVVALQVSTKSELTIASDLSSFLCLSSPSDIFLFLWLW
jgi:hypothetical protein